MFTKYVLPALLVCGAIFSGGELFAQVTPGEFIDTQITAVAAEAETVAQKGTTAMIDIFQWAVVLLVVGMAVAFVWRFLTAGRARC